MSVMCVLFFSVINHTVHCFCQELIYVCRKSAFINVRCNIKNNTQYINQHMHVTKHSS